MSDRGAQFVSRFMRGTCRILGIRQAFTAACHPQTNGQAERFNRTLLASLRAFCGEHPKQWSNFLQAIIYGYKSTVHRATKLTPLQLVLTVPPPVMALRKAQIGDLSNLNKNQARELFTRRLQELMKTATEQLSMAQAAYKSNFDAGARPANYSLQPGDLVFVKRERTSNDDLPIRHGEKKLLSKVTGPYKVLSFNKERQVVGIRQPNGETTTISMD